MTENTLEKVVEAGLKDFDEKFGTLRFRGIANPAFHTFIRTLSHTIAQATSDAVSVEKDESFGGSDIGEGRRLGWNMARDVWKQQGLLCGV